MLCSGEILVHLIEASRVYYVVTISIQVYGSLNVDERTPRYARFVLSVQIWHKLIISKIMNTSW